MQDQRLTAHPISIAQIVRATCLSLGVAALANEVQAQAPDYAPPPGEVVLSTDLAMVQPVVGPPIQVIGGVFRFRHVFIGPGTKVRGVGSRPMVWVVDSMTVAGELSVSGEDGQPVVVLNSAQLAAAAGRGGAAGGDGGAGSPSTIARSMFGATGNGAGNGVGLGGAGGGLGIGPYLYMPNDQGSGGGGGAFATQGDPFFLSPALAGTAFPQRQGQGGFGGHSGLPGALSRNVPGGLAGVRPFLDATNENDFFGFGFDVARLRSIQGELPQLVGGGGGGGGGDLAPNNNPLDPNFGNDAMGGGGGGGGGCLVVVATGGITIWNPGRITANGGNGGGGEQAASCNAGGGGGAGAGGLVVLASFGQIVLQVQGETYANRDYDFVVSADGGVCRTGSFGSVTVPHKYPMNGQPTILGTTYDRLPLGGFGGLGIVQLVTRPGDNSDGTNTLLDDNIVLMRGSRILGGAEKRRYLAWRGYENAAGVRVDDFGAPTAIGSNEGDIRPAPVLIPLF